MGAHAGKLLSEYYKIGSANIYVDTSNSSAEDLFKEKTKSLSGNKYISGTLQDGVSEYTRREAPILAKYGTSTLGGNPDLTLGAGYYTLRYANRVLYYKKESGSWENIHSYSYEVGDDGPKIWIWMSAGGGGGGKGYSSGKIGCGGGGGGAGGAILFPYRLTPNQYYYLVIGTGGNLSATGSDSTFKKGSTVLIRAAGGNNGGDASATGGKGGSGGKVYISSSATISADTIHKVKMQGGSGGDGGTYLNDGTTGIDAEDGHNPVSYILPPIDYKYPLEAYFTESKTGGVIEKGWLYKSLLGGGGGGGSFDIGGTTATGGYYSFYGSGGSIKGSGGEQGGGGGAGQPFKTGKGDLDATNDFNNSWCEGGDGCAHIWYS